MFADVARASLFGLQWMSVTASTDVITKVVMVVVVVGVLLAGGGTAAVAAAMGIPAVSAVILLYPRAADSSATRGHRRDDVANHRAVLKKSSPFCYSSIVTAAYSSLDVVIISLGRHAGGDRLVCGRRDPDGHPPLPTQHHRHLAVPGTGPGQRPGLDRGDGLMGRALRTALIVAIPISFGTIVVADPLRTSCSSAQDFAPAVPVLAIGGVVLLLMFLTILVGGVARATGKITVFNVAVTAATLLTIPLDLVLVPWTRDRFGNGALGGALSFLVDRAVDPGRPRVEGDARPRRCAAPWCAWSSA